MRQIILTLILVLSVLSISSATQQPKAQQWEYKIEQKCFDVDRINLHGADGWELAGYNEGDHGGWHCIFKRPKI